MKIWCGAIKKRRRRRRISGGGGSKKNTQRGTQWNNRRGDREGLCVQEMDAVQPELSSLAGGTTRSVKCHRCSTHGLLLAPSILRQVLFGKERRTGHLGPACEFRTGLPLKLPGHLKYTQDRQVSLGAARGPGEGVERQMPVHSSALR